MIAARASAVVAREDVLSQSCWIPLAVSRHRRRRPKTIPVLCVGGGPYLCPSLCTPLSRDSLKRTAERERRRPSSVIPDVYPVRPHTHKMLLRTMANTPRRRTTATDTAAGHLRTRRKHTSSSSGSRSSNGSRSLSGFHLVVISLIVLAKCCCDAAQMWQENVRPKLYVVLNQDDDVQRFQGNDSAIDHFKLILRDGDSLLVGARWVERRCVESNALFPTVISCTVKPEYKWIQYSRKMLSYKEFHPFHIISSKIH